MKYTISGAVCTVFSAALFASIAATSAYAQQNEGRFSRNTPSQQGRDGGQYIPTISLTPDGCEVWVADDGAEGYAENRVTRQGLPVCHDVNTCGVINTDQFFATDSARLNNAGQQRLAQFFQSSSAFAFTIVGHTDSRASDQYNLKLSYRRAAAVAKVASSVGARIADVRGMGERAPAAPNNTNAGLAKNRRVEVICFQ